MQQLHQDVECTVSVKTARWPDLPVFSICISDVPHLDNAHDAGILVLPDDCAGMSLSLDCLALAQVKVCLKRGLICFIQPVLWSRVLLNTVGGIYNVFRE